MLGGSDRRTLLLVATEWRGPTGMTDGQRTGQMLTVEAPRQAWAGHSKHPLNGPCWNVWYPLTAADPLFQAE